MMPLEALRRERQTFARWLAGRIRPHGGQFEEVVMLSKSGLHPYRAGLFFILRNKRDGWSGPKSNDAVTAGDIGQVAKMITVRLLAEAFGKTCREVARDLIDTYRALEHGEPAP